MWRRRRDHPPAVWAGFLIFGFVLGIVLAFIVAGDHPTHYRLEKRLDAEQGYFFGFLVFALILFYAVFALLR